MTSSTRAIIHITTIGKNFSHINYSRRMYAVLRRYTPEVIEGDKNECYAEITGLRTFFKMTYKEMVDTMLNDLRKEVGVACTVQVAKPKTFDTLKNKSKTSKIISTYKELNKLFAGSSFVPVLERKIIKARRPKLTVPFLGKVS